MTTYPFVTLPAVPYPLQTEPQGVRAFCIVQVPEGYTAEAELMHDGRPVWPLAGDGAWRWFDTAQEAEQWLDDERDEGPDWLCWAGDKPELRAEVLRRQGGSTRDKAA